MTESAGDEPAPDPDSLDHRSIELPQGATIEIRPTSAADARLIAEVYARLSDRDLYRRFFTPFRPNERWCGEWAAISERGGFGVIALLHDPAGPGLVGVPIAEAGYALRSDGDGDLAITIVADRRGWLGGFLLDVLVDHARRAGVTNLQAEVLWENRPMLGLLRHRGAVDLEHTDGILRLSIGTAGHVPSWAPLDTRPKVVVEVPSGRWVGEKAVDAAGLALAMCPGPQRRAGGCPALEGRPCPLVDGADAVVVARDPGDPTTHALIRAHYEQDPSTPVFVRASDDQSADLADLGDLVDVVRPLSDDVDEAVRQLVDAVDQSDARSGDQPDDEST